MITALAHHWDRFFHREVPPHLIAVLRITFGLFFLLYWMTQWVHAPLFSTSGLVSPWILPTSPLYVFFYPETWFMHVFFASSTLFLLSFILGWRSQLSSLLILLCLSYFHLLTQYSFGTSFFRLFVFIFLVYLIPGADSALSLRVLVKHGSLWAWEPVTIFAQRLLALQVSVTYFGVGWQKLFLPDWQSGAILFNSYTGKWATPLGRFFARHLPLSAFDYIVESVKLFEITLPFGLWWKKRQMWFFIGGFIFHTLVTVTMSIWWFQCLIPLYIVFLNPEDVYDYIHRLSRGRTFSARTVNTVQ